MLLNRWNPEYLITMLLLLHHMSEIIYWSFKLRWNLHMFWVFCLCLQTWHTQSLTEMCLLFPYLCRANSVTWNPHKMMGVPLQCSAILVRERVIPFHPLFCPCRHCYNQWSWTQCICLLFTLIFAALPAGIITRLQLHVCWLPLPARQTVRRHLRHRRQGHPVWTSCWYLQVLAHVEGKSEHLSDFAHGHTLAYLFNWL